LTWFLQVRQRLTNYLKGDPGFLTRMRNSYTSFINGCTTPFVDLLEEFFRRRPIWLQAAELNLAMAIEFLLIEEMKCATQVHLVLDSTKAHGCGRDAFVDIFVGNGALSVVMELKNVSLLSLWKAKQRHPSARPKSQNEHAPVLDELHKATEDELLNLNYSFFNKDMNRWETKQVKDILQEATTQLNNYMSIISLGQGEQPRPGRQGRNGIVDDRVWCGDEGLNRLWGYVTICLAGARVICRKTAMIGTLHTYRVQPRVEARL